ncbi:MAG: cyclopropane fatty acyl phospholipid synthase [Deltaproteobacteria bacterium]|nr:cyclopropane fatty acyl phospholipid synthase [Deltaproteobacteria bacterium]
MTPEHLRSKIEDLLALADIRIGGDRPWDIQVHNNRFYKKVLYGGSLALGETYMDSWWDCQRLDDFFYHILRARLDKKVRPVIYCLYGLRTKFLNLQKASRAYHIGRHHYDIGNNLYRCMLDKNMIYSCGYWNKADSLDQAQINKLELTCQKLNLSPGMRVLDIGCGWGNTAKYIAEHYKVTVVGITVSRQQAEFAKELCKDLPVEIHLQDYRTLKGVFDRILSIGMFEHVGYKNYTSFMKITKRLLKPNGIFLLHTIGGESSAAVNDPWIDRYIFPNYMLPSAKRICTAIEDVFVLEDWHCFGADYDKTLMAWFKNFHDHWDILKKDYNDQFYRMWKYYLLSCAASFRARRNNVWQIVLSPEGIEGGYRAPQRGI